MNALRSTLVLLTLAVLAGCGGGVEETFSETTSPDGQWVLRITVAEPSGPQSKFGVVAYVESAAGTTTEVLRTTLENDGVPFTSTNIAPRWIAASTALLCLRATDRPDRGLRIETGAEPRAVEVDQC